MSLRRHAVRFLALVLTELCLMVAAASPGWAGVIGSDDQRPVDSSSGLDAFLAALLPGERNGGPQRTILYEVGAKGDVASDVDLFRRTVTRTLMDSRGWSLDGEVLYVPVHRDGDVRIWLASPQVIKAAHPVCGARYSCRVEDDVYINDVRWSDSSATYADRSLMAYRQYVTNHEFGHWLGLDHRRCPSSGASAWVMQQQTITLDGCQSRVWPQPAEQEAVRRSLDRQDRRVEASPITFLPVPPAEGAATRSSRPGSGIR